MAKPKILLWDIEATNLNANFGYILCIGWQWLGQKTVHVKSLMDFPEVWDKDHTDDSAVLDMFSQEVMDKADMQVHWYGSRFDEPYVNTRLMYHDRYIMPPVPHYDGWRAARYKMKFNSNRLATVAAYFGVNTKSAVTGREWIRAMAGYRDGMKYVVDHCREDIHTLRNVYEKIRMLGTHPNLNVISGRTDCCTRCGSDNLEKRGYHRTNTGVYQRYHCLDCGAWPRSGTRLPTDHPGREILR
jgi:uncharacterized protein YprB with RNaseH-like and TPR domain